MAAGPEEVGEFGAIPHRLGIGQSARAARPHQMCFQSSSGEWTSTSALNADRPSNDCHVCLLPCSARARPTAFAPKHSVQGL